MQLTIIGVLTYRRKRTFDETAYFRQLSKEEQKVGQRGCTSSPRTISSTAGMKYVGVYWHRVENRWTKL
ncbi:hypothetical protein [Brevibacillus centrosporus]|uniref:hypothetical protein n=1 Tax=Brevibacillus centrosporus TaxID=54910 RepID=UPI003987BA80